MTKDFLHTYVSVDCVVFGFDGERLNVLLVEKNGDADSSSDKKLPGSLILQDEDTDQAAVRVLQELTGIKKMALRQFRCFSSKERTSDADDYKWLEKEYQAGLDRLITVAYLSLTKVGRKLHNLTKYASAGWFPVNEIGKMPFDHNKIVEESLGEIRNWVNSDPALLFELLPSKFTEAELRKLYEAIYLTKIDVRNFHKKVISLDYIVPLEEKQKNVAHRAARYYRFDKILYNKRRSGI